MLAAGRHEADGRRTAFGRGWLLAVVGAAGIVLLGAVLQGADVLRPFADSPFLGVARPGAGADGADPLDRDVEVPPVTQFPDPAGPAGPGAGADGDPTAGANTTAGADAEPGASPLTCQPEGCEVWRRALDAGWSLAAAADDHIALVRSRADAPGEVEVAVLDPTDGRERFRRSYAPPPPPAAEGEARVAAAGTQLVLVGRAASLVAERQITSLALDATLYWARQLPLDRFGGSDAVGDRVTLLTGARMRSTLAARTIVVDAVSGDVLWEGDGQPYAALGDHLLIASTAAPDALRVEARGLRNGRLAWRRDGVWPRWAEDGLRLVPLARRTAEGGDLLVDLATGRDVLEVGGVIQSVSAARDGGAYVLVDRNEDVAEGDAYIRPGEWLSGHDDDLEVIAVDRSGEITWRVDVPTRVRGYAWMSTNYGTVVLSADGRPAVGFAQANGEGVVFEPPARLGRRSSGWTDRLDRTVISLDGELGVKRGRTGVDVLGDDLWFVGEDPLVVTDAHELIGVQLVPNR